MINIYFPFMSEDGVLGIGVILEPSSSCAFLFFFTYKKRPLSEVNSLLITGVEIQAKTRNLSNSPTLQSWADLFLLNRTRARWR